VWITVHIDQNLVYDRLYHEKNLLLFECSKTISVENMLWVET
jgi:hypothetical protein